MYYGFIIMYCVREISSLLVCLSFIISCCHFSKWQFHLHLGLCETFWIKKVRKKKEYYQDLSKKTSASVNLWINYILFSAWYIYCIYRIESVFRAKVQALKRVTVIVVFDQIVRGIILGNGFCFTLIFFIQFDLIQKLCYMIFFGQFIVYHYIIIIFIWIQNR